MEKIINGKKVMAQVLGGFQIEKLGKKYIICSFDEEIDKKNNLIMIYEVDENENIVSIPDNEKELVLKFYNNFKNLGVPVKDGRALRSSVTLGLLAPLHSFPSLRSVIHSVSLWWLPSALLHALTLFYSIKYCHFYVK